MADVKKLKIGSTSYDIVDAGARELISELEAYSEYLGVTTTELIDGASTNPIVINGESVIAKKGEIANYGSKEFIFNGSVWQEFGDLSALGELAYEDTAEGSYTPAGSVSQATFTGSSLTSTGSFTPEGSVSKPDVDVTPTTAAIVGVTTTNVPTNAEYDSATETITFTVGSAATLASSVDVLTGVTAALHETPAFTGSAGSVSVTGTPEGTISEQTFTGTAATITVGAPE